MTRFKVKIAPRAISVFAVEGDPFIAFRPKTGRSPFPRAGREEYATRGVYGLFEGFERVQKTRPHAFYRKRPSVRCR